MQQSRGLKYRTKLIAFFLLAVVTAMMAGVYTYVSSHILMQDTAEMFSKNLELTAVYRELGAIQHDLEIYLSTGSSESLLSFYDHSGAISLGARRLLGSADYTPRGVKIKNVSNMINHYLKVAEDTVYAKRGRNLDQYTEGYADLVKQNGYIMGYIEEIMSGDLIDSSEKFSDISSRVQRSTLFNNLLIAVVIIFITAAVIVFSVEVTKPITRLASYAHQISEGNFDISMAPDSSGGEIGLLYSVFNLMAINIKEYVNEIQEKRRLEAILNEQRLNNLKMKTALRESELLALQSQVNPHFIFNTINIGAKIAMMQGDNITCSYLENAADIFRYNLRGLDTDATLGEEIENVSSYMYLLKTRFGDAVRFELDVGDDPGLMNLAVPRMTLQPLVENAYIHGISQLEEGGTISVRVRGEGDCARVTVCDSGRGMSQERIQQLLQGKTGAPSAEPPKTAPLKGHTTGIGIKNVLKRLRLFFGVWDVMEITCTGSETCFTLILPIKGGEPA